MLTCRAGSVRGSRHGGRAAAIFQNIFHKTKYVPWQNQTAVLTFCWMPSVSLWPDTGAAMTELGQYVELSSLLHTI